MFTGSGIRTWMFGEGGRDLSTWWDPQCYQETNFSTITPFHYSAKVELERHQLIPVLTSHLFLPSPTGFKLIVPYFYCYILSLSGLFPSCYTAGICKYYIPKVKLFAKNKPKF